MNIEPDARSEDEDIALRDHLSADRTALANERTLLAYIRTALAFAISGGALIKFFDSPITEVLGWTSLALFLGTTVMGVQRYLAVKRHISHIASKAKETHPG